MLFPSSRNGYEFLIDIPAGGNLNLLLSTPGSAKADKLFMVKSPPLRAGISGLAESTFFGLQTLYKDLDSPILVLDSEILALKSSY